MPDSTIRIATYARVSSDEQRDRHTVLNQRATLDRRLGSEPCSSSSSITRTMASREPSLCKSDRVVVRSSVTLAPAASPRSGSSAPIASVATPSSCSASGDSSSPSASRSAPPTRTSTTLLLRYPRRHRRQRAPQVPRTLRRGHEPRRQRRPLYRRHRPARLYRRRRPGRQTPGPRRLAHVGRPIRRRRGQAYL